MGIKKKLNRGPKINFKDNNLYVLNLSIPQAFELFDSASPELAKPIFESFVLIAISIFQMAQLSISSRPNNAEWVDNLPSYRDIKDKVINSNIGLLSSACIGVTAAFPYAVDEIESENKYDSLAKLAFELAESHVSNVKRIKASNKNWLNFARGELGAAKGQMLSCPSTNLTRLNIKGSEIISYDINESLKYIGFDKSLYIKYAIDKDFIINKLRNIYLMDKNGMPIEKLYYNEPNKINSKIQNEILGDVLTRAAFSASLEKGEEPNSPIDKTFLQKHLTKDEFFAYDIAKRYGDVSILRKYTNLALGRSKGKIN